MSSEHVEPETPECVEQPESQSHAKPFEDDAWIRAKADPLGNDVDGEASNQRFVGLASMTTLCMPSFFFTVNTPTRHRHRLLNFAIPVAKSLRTRRR